MLQALNSFELLLALCGVAFGLAISTACRHEYFEAMVSVTSLVPRLNRLLVSAFSLQFPSGKI